MVVISHLSVVVAIEMILDTGSLMLDETTFYYDQVSRVQHPVSLPSAHSTPLLQQGVPFNLMNIQHRTYNVQLPIKDNSMFDVES